MLPVFPASTALGGVLGGLLVAGLGTASITWASLALLVAAAVAVTGGKRHAIPQGA